MLQEQLEESYRTTYSPGSKRRPRGEKQAKERAPQTGHGPKAQPELPLTPTIHVLDEADQTCPDCRGHLG